MLAPEAEAGAAQLGGAANLAGALQRAASDFPARTVRVHAGDMVGASPLISSHFRDEPAIEAMNLMGFDAGTFGNQEFDEGPPTRSDCSGEPASPTCPPTWPISRGAPWSRPIASSDGPG